jgi:hypothetical protein
MVINSVVSCALLNMYGSIQITNFLPLLLHHNLLLYIWKQFYFFLYISIIGLYKDIKCSLTQSLIEKYLEILSQVIL